MYIHTLNNLFNHLHLTLTYIPYPLSAGSLIFPSAFAGSLRTAGVNPIATQIMTNQTRYPPKNCVRTPAAKMLVKRAGATARCAAITVSASAFSVPSVEAEGAMSFSASWTAAVVVVLERCMHM